MGILNIFSKEIGIDLGTSNVRIADENGKILVNEPTLVALDINTYDIKAVGHEAKNMMGKTPENILCINPMDSGLIADFESMRAMLTYFISNAVNTYSLFQPNAAVTFSSFLTDVEKRSVEDLCQYSGVRDLKLVHKNIAAAYGLNFNPSDPRGHLIINMGGGTIETSLISLGGVVYSCCERTGGEDIDDSIRSIVKRNKKMSIGINTAEEIKQNIASIYHDDLKYEISGHDLVERLPKFDTVTSYEMKDTIVRIGDLAIKTIRRVLEYMPPELSSDIVQEGIYLIGGLANIDGMRAYIETNVSIEVNIPEDPQLITANGIGLYLKKGKDV